MRLAIIVIGLSCCVCACDESDPAGSGSPTLGTQIARETLTGSINATGSPVCSSTFQQSVHPAYYMGGLRRCVEYSRRSDTAGMVIASLQWDDRRIDLDLVLNDGQGSNYRQSIAANRSGERVEFFVNGGTNYIFIIYLRGIDETFTGNGGQFSGDVATSFTLTVERPR